MHVMFRLISRGCTPSVIFTVAVLLYGVVLFVLIPALTSILGDRYGIAFADDYDRLALNIALGNGYRYGADLAPTLMREPGYPLFLAGVFTLFGYSIEAARFANMVLVGITSVLVMRLGIIVGLDRRIAALAALIFVVHPGIVIAAARGGFEIFFILLLTAFVLVLIRAAQARDIKYYALAGFLLGLVVLTRGTLLYFSIIVVAYVWWITRSLSPAAGSLRYGVVVLAIMAVVLSPWVIRNYAITKEIVPTTTMQGVAAHAGQYICQGLSFTTGFQQLDTEAAYERQRIAARLGYPHESGYYQYFRATQHEIDFNRGLLEQVFGQYFSNPMLWARCAAQNAFNFWFAGKTWSVTLINALVQGPFLILAAIGVVHLWRRRKRAPSALLILLILYLYALHMPIHAQARYSVPLIPFLAVFASQGVVVLWGVLRRWTPWADHAELNKIQPQ